MGLSRGFTFKQFHIDHDRCAMKVGTDGILLGAWAPLDGVTRALDIGSGSGLIALMLAQRSDPDCEITGVEIDKEAVIQARENVLASPWSARVQMQGGAIQQHEAEPYDLIVSNPPILARVSLFVDPARAQARHRGALDSRDLLDACSRLLSPRGRVAMVLPTAFADEIISVLPNYDLHELCYVAVITREGKAANRVLLQLSRELNRCERGEIVIHSADGGYSNRYIQLTAPFYLKM